MGTGSNTAKFMVRRATRDDLSQLSALLERYYTEWDVVQRDAHEHTAEYLNQPAPFGFVVVEEDGVLLLCYHGMRAADRGRFERQIRLLRDLGDIIGLSDVVRLLDGAPGHDGRVRGRFICMTFDDGYTDAFDNAFPILAAQNVPAAFFVISGWVDEGRPGIIGWAHCRDLAAAVQGSIVQAAPLATALY